MQKEKIIRMTAMTKGRQPRFTLPQESVVDEIADRPDITILIKGECKPRLVVATLQKLLADLWMSQGAAELMRLPEFREVFKEFPELPGAPKSKQLKK